MDNQNDTQNRRRNELPWMSSNAPATAIERIFFLGGQFSSVMRRAIDGSATDALETNGRTRGRRRHWRESQLINFTKFDVLSRVGGRRGRHLQDCTKKRTAALLVPPPPYKPSLSAFLPRSTFHVHLYQFWRQNRSILCGYEGCPKCYSFKKRMSISKGSRRYKVVAEAPAPN